MKKGKRDQGNKMAEKAQAEAHYDSWQPPGKPKFKTKGKKYSTNSDYKFKQ